MEKERISIPRFRGSKVDQLKKIDLFTKSREPYKETSSVGGTFSVISFLIILWSVYMEINYYIESKFFFRFSPDTDFDAKLKINIDITIAMPCSNVGADILDSTNQNVFRFGTLQEEDTWFESAPNQRMHFDNKKHFNSYLREEYHAVKDLLWRKSYSTLFSNLPPRNSNPDKPYDSCRIYGSLEINKVSGNFHITAGKSSSLPRGHIHISAFMSDRDYNFSHRIDRFSFGDSSPGIIHPLEGDEMITDKAMTLYNYFIEVVPTDVKTFLTTVKTYQYSVKQLVRPINHDSGSHGMPGSFFKYDVAASKVTVSQERDHSGMFSVRLCSVIAGVYICSGFVNNLVQYVYNLFSHKDKKQFHENLKNVPAHSEVVPVKLI